MQNIDETVWTPKLVGDEMIEAIRWAKYAIGRVGPAGIKSSMPKLSFFASERDLEQWPAIQELDPEPMRRSYAPWQVSRFERVLQWPMTYLGDLPKKDPEAIWFFRLWVDCKITKGMKFDPTLDQIGLSRATAYRKRDKILSEIAKGLTRDGIERGRH